MAFCISVCSCTYVYNRGHLRNIPERIDTEPERLKYSGVYWSPDSFEVKTYCDDKIVRFIRAIMFMKNGYVHVFDSVFPETDFTTSENCAFSILNTHRQCLLDLEKTVKGYFDVNGKSISGWGRYDLTEGDSLTMAYGKQTGSLAPIPPMNLFGFTRKVFQLRKDSTLIDQENKIYRFHGFSSDIDLEIKPLEKMVFKHWWVFPIIWRLKL